MKRFKEGLFKELMMIILLLDSLLKVSTFSVERKSINFPGSTYDFIKK